MATAKASGWAKARGHLGPAHLVVPEAQRRCQKRHALASSAAIGGVACGRCWEDAIRDDERAVVLFGLPREIEPDPDYVDQIAVDRVCAGERLPLAAAEKAAAVAVLAARQWTFSSVSAHLGISPRQLRELWPSGPRRAAGGGGEAA